MNKDNIICIYHKGCSDGFGAAWVVSTVFPDADFHGGVYQESPPDLTGKEVIIVDFSYKREVMDQIIEQCNSLLILDHHKTAEADLLGIFDHHKVKGLFDMTMSGAMLTWCWFYPHQTEPRLIKHIEDRDLWKFELEGTKDIIAGLYSYPQEFELWSKLMHDEAAFMSMWRDGVAIQRQQNKTINSLINSTGARVTMCGYNVPIANIPYMFSSDAGHIMAKGEPFSVTYYHTAEKKIYSLRSEENGLDVSEIAKTHGGGGHNHAAGFSLDHGDCFNEHP